LSFGLESTLKKELVIENVRAICWIVPKKYLLLLDQTILLHFRSSIDRPLNLLQYPGSNNYFSIPEENIYSITHLVLVDIPLRMLNNQTHLVLVDIPL
jgi:hypothetical protein